MEQNTKGKDIDAVTRAAAQVIETMLQGVGGEEQALSELARLCVEHDFDPKLLLFYRMKIALDELPILPEVERGWRGATREDIFQDFRSAAMSWLSA
jgi:hypothetical protein